MEQSTKPASDEPKEIRYDSSGKKVITPQRNKETESAILAINDKLDQLLGILSSTLPTRIGTEIREATPGSGGEDFKKVIEILSKELPDRIQADADHNVFQKAEMLSMVISTSFQHLNDAFKSYQEDNLKALQSLTQANQKTSEALGRIGNLLEELRNTLSERNTGEVLSSKPTSSAPATTKAEPKPSAFPSPPSPAPSIKPEEKSSSQPTPVEQEPKPVPPQSSQEPAKEEKTDLPGWLQPKRNETDSSKPPDSPSGIS